MTADIDKMRERYRAAMLASALGDTLGMPVEGWKKEQIKRYVPGGRITEPIEPFMVRDEAGNELDHDEFGKLKYYSRDLHKGDITDDTILSVALAESIVECRGLNLEDVATRQLTEFVTRVKPDGTILGGFGGTTTSAFGNLLGGISPLDSGVIGGPGNAPAMKMFPLGMYMHSKRSYMEGIGFSKLVGGITHLDPRSVVSGVIQAHSIYALLNDVDRDTYLQSIVDVSRSHEEAISEKFRKSEMGNLTSRIQWIKDNKDASSEQAHEHLGSGSLVFRSYPFALFMFQKYWDSPLDGLLETVNYGGDCDTTGAMYGALAGAKNGIFFPESLTKVIKVKDKLIDLADKIYDLRK